MSGRVYSESEFNTILDILDKEKQSVRNLRVRLREVEQKKPAPSDPLTDQLIQDKERLEEALAKSEKQLRLVTIDFEASSQTIGELQQMLQESKREGFQAQEERVGALESEIECLQIEAQQRKQSVSALEEELEEKQQVIEQFRETIESQKSALSEQPLLEEEVAEWKEKAAATEAQLQVLEEEAEEKKQLILTLQEEKGSLQERLEQLTGDHKEVESLANELEKRLDTSEKSLSTSQEENKVKKERLVQLEKALIRSDREKTNLVSELKESEERGTTLQQEVENLEKRLSKRELKLEKLKTALEELSPYREKMVEAVTPLPELTREYVAGFENQLLDLKRAGEAQAHQLQQREREVDALEAERGALSEQTTKLQETLRTQAELIASKQASYESLDEQTKRRIHELESELGRLTQLEKTNLSKIDVINQKLREKSAQQEEATKGAEASRREVVQLKDHLERVQAGLTDKEAQIKTAQQHLTKKLKDISDLTTKSKADNLALSQAETKMRAEQQRFEEMKLLLEKHQSDAQRREQDLKQELLVATEKGMQLAEENRSKDQELASLKAQVAELSEVQERYIKMQQFFSSMEGMFAEARWTKADPIKEMDFSALPTTDGRVEMEKEVAGDEGLFTPVTPNSPPRDSLF